MSAQTFSLPAPSLQGTFSIEQALAGRRSTRQFLPQALSKAEVGQLLWAAQGITMGDGRRTAPSAGAVFPLEIYLIASRVEDLVPGVYKYCPQTHGLLFVKEGRFGGELAAACFNQSCVADGAALICFCGTYEGMLAKYGAGSEKYVDMEVGHASQNVHLQALSLGLGTVVVAALRESEVKALLDLPEKEKPIYLMPVGRPV